MADPIGTELTALPWADITPTDPKELANKAYVDNVAGGEVADVDAKIAAAVTPVANRVTSVEGRVTTLERRPTITSGTAALTPGVSPLTTGNVYLQYE